MTAPTGTRSLNKRDIPQAAQTRAHSQVRIQSPIARTGRITRSQSREIPNSDPTQSAARRKRKGTRQASVGSEGSSLDTDIDTARKGSVIDGADTLEELFTVPEDAIVGYPDLEAATDRDEEAEVDVDEQDRTWPVREPLSPEDHSNLSGTTVRTSHSAQELADLDPSLLVEALEELSDTSSKVLSVVVPTGTIFRSPSMIARELRIPGSPTAERLSRLGAAFRSHAECFGREAYINVPIILRALTGVRSLTNVERGPWRPDNLLYQANVTTFITKIITAERESPDTSSMVALLDRAFPTPFLSSFHHVDTGASELLQETFELALSIRTQLVVIRISNEQSEENFDPEVILRHVFCEPTGRMRGWDMDLGTGIDNLPTGFQQQVMDRVQNIREFFSHSSQTTLAGDFVNVDELKARYSWPEFLAHVDVWARLRLNETNNEVDRQGGAEGIIASLEQETQINLGLEQSGTSATLLPAAQVDSNTSFNTPRGISRLVQRSKNLERARSSAASSSKERVFSSSSQHVPAERDENEAQNEDDWRPADMGDSTPAGSEASPGPSKRVIDFHVDQILTAAEANKENTPQRRGQQKQKAFVDYQPTAQRVEFGTGFEDNEASQQASEAAKGKRRATQVIDCEEEQDDFEQMGDRSDAATRRAAKPAPARRPPAINVPSPRKRQRREAAPEDDAVIDSDDGSDDSEATPPAGSRRPHFNTAQASFDRAVTTYQKVNLAAKKNVATSLVPQVQIRRPWKPEEEERLIEIIEEEGISWTKIAALGDPLLQGRTQAQLKDKARNMHCDYLKSRYDVPRNLGLVPLNKNQRDQLAGLGINYNHVALRAHD